VSDHPEAVELLASLLGFHRREARPAAWWIYARQQMTDAELVEDGESIGGVTYEGEAGAIRRSTIHRYRFDPAQEYKLAAGDDCLDPDTGKSIGKIYAIDAEEGWVEFTRESSRDAATPRALIPGWGPETIALEEALLEIGDWVADNGMASSGSFAAARNLLVREPPHLRGLAHGSPLTDVDDPSLALPDLAARLDSSYLAVQGPPGSGKTHAGAEVICHLAKLGFRVGVTANSHAVVENLLKEVAKFAGRDFEVAKVGGVGDTGKAMFHRIGDNNAETRAIVLGKDGPAVVGGTSWFFSHADLRESFDYLVIDEAGQLSLANALAAATAALNLVLLGDPQQLDQPMQGAHPPGTATSALGHLLGTDDTLRSEFGIFLDRTWRMHPNVCGPISELSYEGRLQSRPHCDQQRLIKHGNGIRWKPVEHHGCRNESIEEARRIGEIVDDLLADQWVDGDGAEAPVTPDDILVIAPYNAQVRRLRSVLGGRARVGTVDKFQGQQAAVVIFSMAASSAEDIPRGLEFQFSRNRLNVAVSRAKCLSILVGSEGLLDANCSSKAQLALVNALCRLVERAEESDPGPH
jgi:hypothetical protein